MALKTKPFRPSDYIQTAEDVIAFIEAAMEEVGPENIKPLLRAVADSVGMTALAEKSGLTRAGLYRALSEEGDPKLSTLKAILDSLGLQLQIVPKEAA